MAKDPAILFYTSDFLSGTELFTFEQKGQYIHLLCSQHQNGHLPETYMLKILGSKDNQVWGKFVQDEYGMWYQQRMEDESKRRKEYSESRRKNIKSRYVDRYVDTDVDSMKPHMETVTVTETSTVNLIKEEKASIPIVVENNYKSKTEEMLNIQQLWNEFAKKHGLAEINTLPSFRRMNILARLREENFNFEKILEAVGKQEFLLGKNNHGWKVTFDWITENEKQYTQILEGNYLGSAKSNTNKPTASTGKYANVGTKVRIETG